MFLKFLLKNMKVRHELIKKYGPKILMKNFCETKNLIKILERLKQKIDIFIGTKNIFNFNLYTVN